jgi:hypothetical protein
LADESGATAIEYGLIAAGISVAIMKGLGTTQHDLFLDLIAVEISRLGSGAEV